MLSPPQIVWRTQPNFLYTLLLINGDVEDALEVTTSLIVCGSGTGFFFNADPDPAILNCGVTL